MNRREFLKVGMAAVAAAVVPAIAVGRDEPMRFGKIDNVRFIGVDPASGPDHTAIVVNARQHGKTVMNEWANFEAQHEYGNGIHVMSRVNKATTERMLNALYEDMCKHIPPMYREQVGIYGPLQMDYGHSTQVAWRYVPPGAV